MTKQCRFLVGVTIQIDHEWGNWAAVFDPCPVGTIAIGFKTKIDNLGNFDETGMNGMALTCSDPWNSTVTSNYGTLGPWATSYQHCPHGYDQAQARIQPDQVQMNTSSISLCRFEITSVTLLVFPCSKNSVKIVLCQNCFMSQLFCFRKKNPTPGTKQF